MKAIKLFTLVFSMVLFAQCSKDEAPIDELITEEMENYEDMEKIETVWEEGCGKPSIEELLKEMDEQYASTVKMQRNLYYVWDIADIGVIRLGTHCGNYPTLEVRMDCEDTRGKSDIYKYGNAVSDLSWLANGVQKINSDIKFYFCLIPRTSIPVSRNQGKPYGVLDNVGQGIPGWGGGYGTGFDRFFDNEDTRNGNSSSVLHGNNERAVIRENGNSGDMTLYCMNQNKDTRFRFIGFFEDAPFHPTQNLSFHNLGFPYAVFSRFPIGNFNMVAEIVIDDEDKNNINSWGFVREYRDYDFINGSTNTKIYVARAI